MHMTTQRKWSNLWMAIAATMLALVVSGARAASNSEQIVFSGIGLPSVSSAPFGFWIWCQNEQAEPSVGRSHYETDCNGAMYFYALGVVTHVVGEVSELSEGVYLMDVSSTDGSVDCMLQNVPPIRHGPNNTVVADCTVNGTALHNLKSENAVVNATGP